MTSPRSNRGVANQFLITTSFGTYFQSYESLIAYIPNEAQRAIGAKVTLDKNYWDYSTTTGKYRNQFLREDKATTERKIKSGEYVLDDLNKEWYKM